MKRHRGEKPPKRRKKSDKRPLPRNTKPAGPARRNPGKGPFNNAFAELANLDLDKKI
jgi:hypothetical protein